MNAWNIPKQMPQFRGVLQQINAKYLMQNFTSELGCCPYRGREDRGESGMSTECHRRLSQEWPCTRPQSEIGGDDWKRCGGNPWIEKWRLSGGVGTRSQRWQQTNHNGVPWSALCRYLWMVSGFSPEVTTGISNLWHIVQLFLHWVMFGSGKWSHMD